MAHRTLPYFSLKANINILQPPESTLVYYIYFPTNSTLCYTVYHLYIRLPLQKQQQTSTNIVPQQKPRRLSSINAIPQRFLHKGKSWNTREKSWYLYVHMDIIMQPLYAISDAGINFRAALASQDESASILLPLVELLRVREQGCRVVDLVVC